MFLFIYLSFFYIIKLEIENVLFWGFLNTIPFRYNFHGWDYVLFNEYNVQFGYFNYVLYTPDTAINGKIDLLDTFYDLLLINSNLSDKLFFTLDTIKSNTIFPF